LGVKDLMDIPKHLLRFPTAEARTRLSERLQLPYDSSMQDWEWEIADPKRIRVFLDLYEAGDLSEDERFSLMEIIIQSAEESADALLESKEWKRALHLLGENIAVHIHSVWYWAVPEAETQEELWRVSPDLRQLLQKHQQQSAQQTAAELIEWYGAGYITRSELADRLIDLASTTEPSVLLESVPAEVMAEVAEKARDCPVDHHQLMFVHGHVPRLDESEAERAARLARVQLSYAQGANRIGSYLSLAQQTAARDRAKRGAEQWR
jgi:hypothetical protein